MNSIRLISIIAAMSIYGCGENPKQNDDKKADQEITHHHCAAKTTDIDWYSSGKKAPIIPGLEGIQFHITTKNPEAQQYFNQGMMLSYGFNHAEAARSFYEATRLDSTCAICYWGYALVLGPNYNGGMEPGNFERAYEASRKASALRSSATPIEQALIDALQSRYVKNPPEDRSELDIAYSAAMKKVSDQFPDDPDVGALYAESLMDLHPWNLYDKKTKAPHEWTPEILRVLEHQMKLHPRHPGAHHFYIHAIEASAFPEKGKPSAELLATLVPGSGHLIHMPSHIYINTGDYHLGSIANVQAVKVDEAYATACGAHGVYPLAYYPHNYHFLAATATLEGDSKLAWDAAMKVQKNTATDLLDKPLWSSLQHYYCVPYFVAVKLEMWDTLLTIASPIGEFSYPEAIYHYARGMAFCGKMDVPAAEKELAEFRKYAADTSLKELTIWGINKISDVVAIAEHVLSGSIAKSKDDLNRAVKHFKEGVLAEDQLNYDEPPDWFFSVRHYLGDALLSNFKFAEAEKVFLEDLQTWKENGWALAGLHEALKMQKKTKEADQVLARFEKAWQFADVKPSAFRE